VTEIVIMVQQSENRSPVNGTSKRSNKFPLTLHPTGQYCKKIRGRMYYFGKDRQEALRSYYEHASSLHTGKAELPITGAGVTLRNLCNRYLEHQDSRVATGEIKRRYFYDQTLQLKDFAKFIGPNEAIAEIKTYRVQNYRQELVKEGKAAATHWKRIHELIERRYAILSS